MGVRSIHIYPSLFHVSVDAVVMLGAQQMESAQIKPSSQRFEASEGQKQPQPPTSTFTRTSRCFPFLPVGPFATAVGLVTALYEAAVSSLVPLFLIPPSSFNFFANFVRVLLLLLLLLAFPPRTYSFSLSTHGNASLVLSPFA